MTTILLVVGLVVVAGVGIWFLVRTATAKGRATAQRDAAKGSADAARKAHAIDEDVARMSDARLDDELRADRRDD